MDIGNGAFVAVGIEHKDSIVGAGGGWDSGVGEMEVAEQVFFWDAEGHTFHGEQDGYTDPLSPNPVKNTGLDNYLSMLSPSNQKQELWKLINFVARSGLPEATDELYDKLKAVTS